MTQRLFEMCFPGKGKTRCPVHTVNLVEEASYQHQNFLSEFEVITAAEFSELINIFIHVSFPQAADCSVPVAA